jgi:hypothetical protein
MDHLHVVILSIGALLSLAGLILLGLGWPSGRISRRMVCIGAPFLPVLTYTAWLASYAPSPPGHGGFFSPWTLGLMMLVPWLLLWLVACFAAWVIGNIMRQG